MNLSPSSMLSQTCTFCLWLQQLSLVCLHKVISAFCPASYFWISKLFRHELITKLSFLQNVKHKVVWKIMITKKTFHNFVNGDASRSTAGKEVKFAPKIHDYSYEHKTLSRTTRMEAIHTQIRPSPIVADFPKTSVECPTCQRQRPKQSTVSEGNQPTT